MTQIFLVRHGEAEGNLYRRAQGQTDVSLTAEGKRQLPYLTARFSAVKLDAAYASDLRRAYDTALACVGNKPLTVIREPRLREMGFGAWENHPWGEINRFDTAQKTAFLFDPAHFSVPGCENFYDVQSRTVEAMREIGERHDGQNVLVACHGMVIRIFFAWLRGVPSERIDEVDFVDNTAVSLLQYENGSFTLAWENDTAHLPKAPWTPVRDTKWKKKGHSSDLWYRPFDLAHEKKRYTDCYRDAWRTAHGTEAGFDAQGCYLAAKQYAAASPMAVQCAMCGDSFAGVLTLDERRGADRGYGWIAFLYVVPEMRGKRCGIQLVGSAVMRFRELGRSAVRLTVAAENDALGFYEWAGFRRVGTTMGALGELYIMELSI